MSRAGWIIAESVIFIVLLFSEPPQVWFWLVLFVVILLYRLEQDWPR